MDTALIETPAIHGLRSFPLKVFESAEGSLLHMMTENSPAFKKFGEVYISTIVQGAIKAWKKHDKMTLNLAVPYGAVSIVIYDERELSPSYGCIQEIILSRAKYELLQLPPLLWYGFRGVGEGESIIVNCADLPHDPDEIHRLPAHSEQIPYLWP